MLFAEALETVRYVDDGVLTSVVDANIGSILGIGFPACTGGVLQYINQYEGGLPGFVTRARELAASTVRTSRRRRRWWRWRRWRTRGSISSSQDTARYLPVWVE